ncbi:MAG: cobalamin-dependent protein [Actinobacteria bacterium]|nr:cobalamin-dependent protein [Actinomycetota bacterium]
MEIVLINPYPEGASGINEATIEPPLGLAYLAAVLEKDGHTCQIIDANILRMKNTEVLKNISYTNPDCFGISMNVITCRSGFELIKKLRQQYPSTLIIIGGPYPSSLPKYSLEGSEADLVVIGEGELTMREIMNNFPNWKSVHGIAYKENGQIFFNTIHPKSKIVCLRFDFNRAGTQLWATGDHPMIFDVEIGHD